jgi:hypothetical protein
VELSIRKWRPGHLLASWAAYWTGLAAVTLGPVGRAAWRATHLPDGHGSIEAGFANGVLHLTVVEEGVRTIVATAPLGTAMAWIIGPPLGIWLVWLAVRSRHADSGAAELRRVEADQLPPGAPPAAEWRARGERARVERDEVRTPNP